jgi:membrane protease YdiL (CAAX protease family)
MTSIQITAPNPALTPAVITPALVLAAILTLAPLVAAAFWPARFAHLADALPTRARLIAPALLALPYLLVAVSTGTFHWFWLSLYALLPVAIAALLLQARAADPDQHGTWRDFFVLATVGLAVDLRWFEPAWPPHLAVFSKILLLDAGIYGFLAVRRLHHVGFDLRLRLRDLTTAARELLFYAPAAIALGLALGFLHVNPQMHWVRVAPFAFVFTFFFIAIPEELFFRGWLQNLLERRLGRTPALAVTAILFGLAHFNKRTAHFNWRYVLLAAIAGIFYGRAWRQDRRVAASALTHAAVDTLWSLFLR